MKKFFSTFFAPIIALLLVLFFSCTYSINEGEQVIITEFGKPVGLPINSDPQKNEAGLHFKKPFIQTVNRIEKRVLEWDGPASDMPTRDKLYITVDNFARWRIADPQKYFESLRDERSAQSRLDDAIGGATRSVIAQHDLIEVVRSDKARKSVPSEEIQSELGQIGVLPTIRYGRHALDKEILAAAKPKAKLWGIELIDVRFKRINYKAGVIQKIYDRMESERRQIASRYISEGDGEAAKIQGRMERDLLQIKSEAYRKEQEIRGKADAKATQIYADAYNSSPLAADFYQFIKTLDTYTKTLKSDTTAIFTTNSELFHLLKDLKTPASEPVPTP
ncbi:MAG: HflC protein [Verrucomicrobiia bacterium Tous-C3TDCM]|nr:MAG: HflC protein [Verrucomicrobiae bacterium Tous-C3TDCM]PAZ06835.1 MAG: HflC protein [Verrucomicrobiae bacterium AMD-G2]